MFTSRHLIAGFAAAATLLTGAGVAAASGDDGVPSLDEVQTAEVDPDVDTPEHDMIGFSADVRINGHRVQEEWYFAFGVNDHWPHFGSLWLLTDAEADEWVPLCLGFFHDSGDGSIFLGESIHGDEGDGCAMLGIGDEGDVFFAAVELEGEEILTASLYAFPD